MSSASSPAAAAVAEKSTMDRVMDEIISTEESYQSDLRTMISLYVAPLKRSQILSGQQHLRSALAAGSVDGWGTMYLPRAIHHARVHA